MGGMKQPCYNQPSATGPTHGVKTMNATASLFFKSAILLLLTGMGAGIVMSASGDHSIAGAHAHLNLLGFVVSAVYGTYFALAPAKATGRLPTILWALHTVGVAVMFVSLSMLLKGTPEAEPVVALSSIAVFIAAILFAVVVFKPAPAATLTAARA